MLFPSSIIAAATSGDGAIISAPQQLKHSISSSSRAISSKFSDRLFAAAKEVLRPGSARGEVELPRALERSISSLDRWLVALDQRERRASAPARKPRERASARSGSSFARAVSIACDIGDRQRPEAHRPQARTHGIEQRALACAIRKMMA